MNNMICQSCNKEKKIIAKGLCNACYIKKRYENNPEAYARHKETSRKWNKNNPDKVKKSHQKWCENDPKRAKESKRKSMRKYLEKHPEYKIKSLKSLEKLKKTQVCNILKKHAEDLKDDPERLSTEFLQSIIGTKCKDKK